MKGLLYRRFAPPAASGLTGFSDTWTGVDNTLVAGRTTETGSKVWSDAMAGACKILTNALAPNVSGDCGAVADAGTQNATVTATLTAFGTAIGVIGRWVDVNNYIVFYWFPGAPAYGCKAVIAGIPNVYDGSVSAGIVNPTLGDTIGLGLSGSGTSTVASIYHNGTLKTSFTLTLGGGSPTGTKFGAYVNGVGTALSDNCVVTVP
jgi:hypothetical protein